MSIPITIYQNTKDELDKSKNIKKSGLNAEIST